jgi:hypothetical protein
VNGKLGWVAVIWTIRSGAFARHKPREKYTPGIAALNEGPPSPQSNTQIRK